MLGNKWSLHQLTFSGSTSSNSFGQTCHTFPMVARFFILLPFDLFITEENDWFTIEGAVTGGTAEDFGFRVLPPTLNAERPKATDTVLSQGIGKISPPCFTDSLLVNGKRVAPVNILTVDIIKPNFDRSRPAPLDPNPEAAFEIANEVLSRLRVYSRAFEIEPLSSSVSQWQLRYLTDELKDLEEENGKSRGVMWMVSSVGQAAITPELFSLVRENWQSKEPFVWDQLILDARKQLPDVGGSIIMAAAALETFIAYALDILHQGQPLPEGLWSWINDRGDWRKEPSVKEQFDTLLTAFSRRSIKLEEPLLWESFVNLKAARDALSHEGIASVGKKAKPIDAEEATRFVSDAERIILWIEQLLPQKHRRLRSTAPGPYARRMATQEESNTLGLARITKGQSGELAPGAKIAFSFDPKSRTQSGFQDEVKFESAPENQ